MKIEKVRKLKPLDIFLYWCRERHQIYLRRQAGEPKPWTDDEVLQNYFFTNPYRENDKTTVWFREHVRHLIADFPQVLTATVIFRWFNKIETGRVLNKHRLLEHWDSKRAIKLLRRLDKPFTGAFMIPAPPGSKKIEHVCSCIDNVWKDRQELLRSIDHFQSLEHAHTLLMGYPWLGGFMSYEVVTDLRHTYLLENAGDIMTWANPGPGCARGLWRLRGKSYKGIPAAHGCKPPDDWLEQMQELLAVCHKRLPDTMPKFEMREVEHSLCEYDKMSRLLFQEGRAKRRYKGV